MRLVRSKGVGVYFVTQNPLDIPDSVLGQLGNRVQHALRAFTPRDQKAVAATAQTMRPKKGLDIEAAITDLAVGEALETLMATIAAGLPALDVGQLVWSLGVRRPAPVCRHWACTSCRSTDFILWCNSGCCIH